MLKIPEEDASNEDSVFTSPMKGVVSDPVENIRPEWTLEDSDVECSVGERYRAPARWRFFQPEESQHEISGPQHQTLRRKGVAPIYPKPFELIGATPGALSVGINRIDLIPTRQMDPSGTIYTSDLSMRIFYRNAIEFTYSDGRRVVVGLAPNDIETIDVLMQAYMS